MPGRSLSRPRLRPLAVEISRQTGFGLVETLLTIGAVSLMSLAVYGIFFASDITAEVKDEQTSLNTLSTNIDRSFGLTGGFSGVSLGRIRSDGLLPSTYTRSGSVLGGWGSSVDVRANAVSRPNDSFIIDYAHVPAEACARLAAAMAPSVYDLRVAGSSVMGGGGLDPAAATAACQQGARMEFVYFSGLTSGTAVATPALTLPAAPPSVDPANPTTPSTPVSGAPSVDDVAAPPPSAATPGSPVAPPPAIPPVPPAGVTPTTPQPIPSGVPSSTPPSLTACVAPPSTTGHQQVACPAGQFGITNQQRIGNYACPEAWEAAVLVWGGWTNTSSSCQNCPAPSTESRTQWVGSSASCPSGQVGIHTWEREQSASRRVNYSCPAGTTTLPPPTYGGWSAWVDTGARRNEVNTCVSATPRCSDGSLQVAAWYSADYDQLPMASSVPVAWYGDALVKLTPAERSRFQWAQANAPSTRTETPAPNGMNMPPNVSQRDEYGEKCEVLSDVGNIHYLYTYDFECVSDMGMHYCDYNNTTDGYWFMVCRQGCASDLVGKSNNPYKWKWPDTTAMAAIPYVTCTGQPGCSPNGGYESQTSLPACNEYSVGQVVSHRWYRQFYNPSRVVYQQFNVTCTGPKP